MKMILTMLFTLAIGVVKSQSSEITIEKSAYLTLNQMPPYLFFFELVPYQARGKISFYSDHMHYVPKKCFPDKLDRLAKLEFFPCNNHVISEIQLPYSEIKKVRRGYRLGILVPNMLVLKDDRGNKYRFQFWGRGKVIKLIKNYKEY
ncbi:MAG: hypothetical protein J0L66_03865 [Cytophagales bacterium]|nr:hypothetical protein [Cytophagales bacterium]